MVNPNVSRLLAWHGHDKGGVRVPFGNFGLPLGRVVETGILARLRVAAATIARRDPGPRWIFLVGGPGNGKSQMVEEFVRLLDDGLNCHGQLISTVSTGFQHLPTPRQVEVDASETNVGGEFANAVGKLIIIQDASASDTATLDAAQQLSDDLLNLLTEPRPSNAPIPVFVCCVNRGLLARALTTDSSVEDVTELLETVARTTGLGQEALQVRRLSNWPVEASSLESHFPELKGIVASWPMDMESLIYGFEEGEPPFATIVLDAVSEQRWEEGGCALCDNHEYCPLYRNAQWLRESDHLTGLLQVLRRQELATGQRWNFRLAFSLVAELLVGEWEDYYLQGVPAEHPCLWVDMMVDEVNAGQAHRTIPALLELVQRLYPQALFAGVLPSPTRQIQEVTEALPIADGVVRWANEHVVGKDKFIRRYLLTEVLPIVDPARWSPEKDVDALCSLEDGYSQSVAAGNANWPEATPKARTEEILFDWLARAEEECEQASDGLPAKALASERFIRLVAATIAKRSAAIRLGRHGQEEYLAQYERTIRDPELLTEVHLALRDMLNSQGFRADALASLGQPESRAGRVVTLVSPSAQIRPIRPAPPSGAEFPMHDIPAIPIASRAIPLTYDLFVALRLRASGCSSASMPAGVRAALDLMKQLYAGEVCRKEDLFLATDAYFEIEGGSRLVLTAAGGTLRLRGAHGR